VGRATGGIPGTTGVDYGQHFAAEAQNVDSRRRFDILLSFDRIELEGSRVDSSIIVMIEGSKSAQGF
jgi:hypothetical protein